MSARARDYRPEDAEGVSTLWQRCFGDAAGGQTADWLFRPGPAGEAPRSVIEIDGRVVAHAGVAPLRVTLEGESGLGGYSVGAMTDPAHRGQGLFVEVGEHLYARLADSGFAFVAGFSNAQSERLMTTRLGRTSIRPFPWCVRVLRPFDAARRVLLGGADAPPDPGHAPGPEPAERGGDWELSPCPADDPRLDELWSRAGACLRVAGVRDAAFARWRFGSRSDAGYAGCIAERGGEPGAWIVYRDLRLRGLQARFVVDCLVAPERESAGRALLDRVERGARRSRCHLLSALLPSEGPAREALRGAGYRRVPERLHPQVIRFSARGFGRFEGSPALSDPAAWYLTWSDTDVV